MGKKHLVPGLVLGILIFFFSHSAMAGSVPEPSGQIVNGFRVLKAIDSGNPLHWIVYRGDYIKFDIDQALADPVLAIPGLSVKEKLLPDLEQTPYFKMKEMGIFEVFIGSLAGTLEVVEYYQANYEAVSAQQALSVIESLNPLILDVRTPKEYAAGHLENSVLIPVQQLQARLEELAEAKDQPILIYCATGNRSTVASKILIDKGFARIFNLKQGIVDWAKSKYPIVKSSD